MLLFRSMMLDNEDFFVDLQPPRYTPDSIKLQKVHMPITLQFIFPSDVYEYHFICCCVSRIKCCKCYFANFVFTVFMLRIDVC